MWNKEQYSIRIGPSAHNICAEHDAKTMAYLPAHDPCPSILYVTKDILADRLVSEYVTLLRGQPLLPA